MTGLLTLLRMMMGFVIAKVIAIYTGPTGIAMLGQVQSMVTSLNGIINAPAGSGVIRFTAEKKDAGFDACAPWWRASFQWILVISAFMIPSGLLLADNIAVWLFQDSTLRWIVIATICVLPLSAVGTLCNSVINGQQLYRRYVILGMISTIISSCIMLTMIIQYNIEGALLSAAVQSGLIGLVMLVANFNQAWLKLSYWWGETDNKARKQIGGYLLMAITTALTIPVSLILVRSILIDQVGWDATGQWQAVWKISEVYLTVITMALGTYYLPRLASLSGVEAIVNEINKTIRIVVPIVTIMALGIYILRDVVITLLFTEDFRNARELFAFQLTGDIIKISSWLYAYPMISRGATKWFVSTEIVFSLLFVGFNYLFISYMGLQGAPLAYLINYIVYFIFVFSNVKRFSR
ncbi:O-antigen translocase [Vibrio lentus]|uniref:O-antigen translocase n=1 Tax=Vibrio lentus TaxID=136468 RepID=UPI0023EA4CCF|nr:O-antigen translocase [Vibrio lentus]